MRIHVSNGLDGVLNFVVVSRGAGGKFVPPIMNRDSPEDE